MDKKNTCAGEIAHEKLTINPAWCKGCGICIAFCPKKVLSLENDKVKAHDIESCVQCGACEMRCPDFAIHVGRKKNEK